MTTEKARWYAFYDHEKERWYPLFCVPSFSKWTDVEIDDTLGNSLLELRSVACQGTTAKEIAAAIQYATLGKQNDAAQTKRL